MSGNPATDFIELVMKDEEVRKAVLKVAQQLDIDGIHKIAQQHNLQFSTDDFIKAYKSWYEEMVKNLNVSKDKEEEMLGVNPGDPEAFYLAGPYLRQPYTNSDDVSNYF